MSVLWGSLCNKFQPYDNYLYCRKAEITVALYIMHTQICPFYYSCFKAIWIWISKFTSVLGSTIKTHGGWSLRRDHAWLYNWLKFRAVAVNFAHNDPLTSSLTVTTRILPRCRLKLNFRCISAIKYMWTYAKCSQASNLKFFLQRFFTFFILRLCQPKSPDIFPIILKTIN